jgi:hypothetical protein
MITAEQAHAIMCNNLNIDNHLNNIEKEIKNAAAQGYHRVEVTIPDNCLNLTRRRLEESGFKVTPSLLNHRINSQIRRWAIYWSDI